MPLPSHIAGNWSFQQRNFNGFRTQGPCFLLDRMRLPLGLEVQSMMPGPFAVIDDWQAVDEDGERVDSVYAPGVRPADTSAFSVHLGMDVLWAIDGAWIELDGVQIDPGESLRFMWKFVSPPSLLELEDFALFLVQEEGSRDWRQALGSPLARTFASSNSFYNAEWNSAVWTPHSVFRGRLRWLCSNGFRKRERDGPPSDEQRRSGASYPASLLLDGIRID